MPTIVFIIFVAVLVVRIVEFPIVVIVVVRSPLSTSSRTFPEGRMRSLIVVVVMVVVWPFVVVVMWPFVVEVIVVWSIVVVVVGWWTIERSFVWQIWRKFFTPGSVIIVTVFVGTAIPLVPFDRVVGRFHRVIVMGFPIIVFEFLRCKPLIRIATSRWEALCVGEEVRWWSRTFGESVTIKNIAKIFFIRFRWCRWLWFVD